MKTNIFGLALCLLAACKSSPDQPALQSGAKDTASTVRAGITPLAKADTGVTYETYCNARYGYCLSYPAALVVMQPEAESGDGRIFNNSAGEELGRVYRSMIADPDVPALSPKEAMKAALTAFKAGLAEEGQGAAEIPYATSGKDFYVFSAKAGKWIYYRKAIFKADEYALLIFKYPEEQKAQYDVVVSRMSQSFHW
ncbi:MAG: hypothetical protein EOP49_15540 [Sphingobacteriales bacterium]|nr:MAG: hypothetical protein EOP49_15540 [Sphingobacteriales bacterium]